MFVTAIRLSLGNKKSLPMVLRHTPGVESTGMASRCSAQPPITSKDEEVS